MSSIRIAVLLACLAGSAYGQRTQPSSESTDGSVLYKAYCTVCHGIDAKGDGPMARNLRVKPPDLTRLAALNGGTFPMVRVRRLISGDEELQSGHGTKEMPLWGPIFSRVAWDRDLRLLRIDNIAKYLAGMQK